MKKKTKHETNTTVYLVQGIGLDIMPMDVVLAHRERGGNLDQTNNYLQEIFPRKNNKCYNEEKVR